MVVFGTTSLISMIHLLRLIQTLLGTEMGPLFKRTQVVQRDENLPYPKDFRKKLY